jgi:polar amino acid transport system substrate-binding protein
MGKALQKTLILFVLVFFFSGCAAPSMESKPEGPRPLPLRVGVFPYYPPMIFKQNDEFRGAEADLAIRLAKMLGREAQFVELWREQLIPALIEGKIDIVMSGMTITEARKARVDFTEPYLKMGLVTLMRAQDASKFNSLTSIQESFATVGVVKGTTGEAFVRNHFLKAANIISFQKASEARYLLVNRRIDLFVHDAPSVVWLVSENEGTLKGFWEPFDEEYLGWAVNRGDQDFYQKVNNILKNWKTDGTLKGVLTRWLPYWKDFE